ncbi:histone deacetylase complex subunit SAP30 Sin3-binding domain-containing protein [Aspergillus lucknowensis]|uniref:Histone deacetylase complex subunit SAP30 Sin3 binding domain-containing protein n=1 Tax=Aspergillus lucknowensis TaxID=176173 RepID=A0ABR4M811_9EURO
MAPPRQRATAAQEDSRSEASSTTTKEQKASSGKGKRGANGVMMSSVSRESRVTTNVTSAPASRAEQLDNLPKISWPDMPLEFLHSYRHAYKLTSPSAYSTEYAHNLLSQGIGLLSPTAIAAQRAQISGRDSQRMNDSSSDRSLHHASGHNGVSADHHTRSKGSSTRSGKNALNSIVSQGRVSKNQLATAVRKHFNGAGLVEQEAIARFLYKVREEGRGRQFRLKFQP